MTGSDMASGLSEMIGRKLVQVLVVPVVCCLLVIGYVKTEQIFRPERWADTESTAALQIDAQQTEIQQLQGELESYRLYSSKTAESLVDLNIQLREKTNECERLERENMRLERRAMGLVEGDE